MVQNSLHRASSFGLSQQNETEARNLTEKSHMEQLEQRNMNEVESTFSVAEKTSTTNDAFSIREL